MIMTRKTIFDVINEADDDESTTDSSASDNNSDTGTENDNDANTNDDTGSEDNADTNDDASDDNNHDTDTAKDDNSDDMDEDFDIDTNLDDSGDDSKSDDDTDSSSDDSSTDSSSSSGEDNMEEKPIPANTDIFSSLSPEEQSIKIKELKNLYNELYTSCDDLLERINTIDPEDDTIDIISRISSTMYSLKIYIADYITNVFATKSYIENDIAFNRFLSILKSVTSVIEDITKVKNDNLGKTDKK